MATTATYDESADLDVSNAVALEFIQRQRARRRVLVLSLLGAALLALLATTFAMYARAPAAPHRTGTADIPQGVR